MPEDVVKYADMQMLVVGDPLLSVQDDGGSGFFQAQGVLEELFVIGPFQEDLLLSDRSRRVVDAGADALAGSPFDAQFLKLRQGFGTGLVFLVDGQKDGVVVLLGDLQIFFQSVGGIDGKVFGDNAGVGPADDPLGIFFAGQAITQAELDFAKDFYADQKEK